MIRLNKYKNLDWYLIIAVVALSIFGIICIGSATHINLGESRSTYYSQIVWVSVGVIIMFIVANVNLEFFSNFYKYIYIFNIIFAGIIFYKIDCTPEPITYIEWRFT